MLVLLASALLSATAPVPPHRVLLKAARLFDGHAEISGGVGVLVENEKIVAAGKGVTAPPGAEVIDLGDATLLPGLIDAHTHLSFEMGDDWYREAYTGLLRGSAEQALHASVFARRTLEAGFTTVRDLGSNNLVDVGLRNAIEEGDIAGPRMLVAVHAIGATGGHMDADPFAPEQKIPQLEPIDGICNGADACRAAVRYQVKYGADVIKIAASGGVLSLADEVDTPQLTDAELAAIIDEAHRLRRKVAAHCHGDQAAKAAIRAGVDSIEHGSFLKPDTLALMKSRGVYLVPTLMTREALIGRRPSMPAAVQKKADAAVAAVVQMFKEAVRLGVPIGLGTDSAVTPHGQNAHELVWMVKLGMSPAAALQAATSANATLLNVPDRGTLSAGKLADVIAVPGDPLANIDAMNHVSLVMKGGQVVKR